MVLFCLQGQTPLLTENDLNKHCLESLNYELRIIELVLNSLMQFFPSSQVKERAQIANYKCISFITLTSVCLVRDSLQLPIDKLSCFDNRLEAWDRDY